MLKKNIKVDLIYVGGHEQRRRKVLEIRENGDVKYVTVTVKGRYGVTKACSLKAFAEWADGKDRLLGKPYSKQKLSSIHHKRLAREGLTMPQPSSKPCGYVVPPPGTPW